MEAEFSVPMAISKNGEIVESGSRDLHDCFQAFLSGDDAAFLELYRELNPRLSAYCHKLAPAHADDLMQELWEHAIAMRASSFRKRQGVANPAAFLFRMLKNLAIDEYRKTKDEISIDAYPSYTTEGSHGNDGKETTEIEALVLESFEKLPAGDKEILVLNIYSGYDFGEIAEMLGKSTDAIWQRASRARAKLRTIVIDDAKRMGVALPKMNASSNAKKNQAII